jgi:uncharacterized membrane protein YbhN (UPF0104 family)
LARKLNKTILFALKVSVSSALLYYVLAKTGIKQVASTLKTVNIYAFFSSVGIYIFTQIISTMRWKLFLPEGFKTKKLFSLYMIGSFFNTFMPGVIGGDAVKAYYLYRETNMANISFGSIFMDRYLGFIGLLILCSIAFPFGLNYFHGSKTEWLLPFAIFIFFFASFLIFGLRLGQRIRFLAEFYNYFHTYRSQKNKIIKGLILSMIIQFFGVTSVSVLAYGLGENIPFLSFLIFVPLIILFAMLPVSISGFGVREGAFVFFFGLIGVRSETATALSLLWFLTMATAGIIGLIEYLKYKKEIITLKE